MTLLEDLEQVAKYTIDRDVEKRMREYAKRLRSEMNVRADNPLMIHVLQFINGGPAK